MIKICINPMCEEIAHNIDKKETRCRNCEMLLVEITKSTWLAKFLKSPNQVDYATGDRIASLRELGINYQLSLFQ